MIGTSYVDFAPLALDTSQKENSISGYFHCINKGDVRSSKDLSFLETNQMSRESKGQLKVTIRAESDKNGQALRSTIMFPESLTDNRKMHQSMAEGLMTSQETFGNRLNNQHMYQSYSVAGAGAGQQSLLAASTASPLDDEFDVDREQPREEKKFEQMIN